MQEGGSWGVPGMVPVQEGGGSCARWGFLGGSWDSSCAGRWGFLSDMHMPQATRCAQFKPSNSPPLALPLPLTLGK